MDDKDHETACQHAEQARRGSPYLLPKEAARYLRIKPQTLAKMRMQKRGPRYDKRGRFIRYRVADLDAWLKANPQ